MALGIREPPCDRQGRRVCSPDGHWPQMPMRFRVRPWSPNRRTASSSTNTILFASAVCAVGCMRARDDLVRAVPRRSKQLVAGAGGHGGGRTRVLEARLLPPYRGTVRSATPPPPTAVSAFEMRLGSAADAQRSSASACEERSGGPERRALLLAQTSGARPARRAIEVVAVRQRALLDIGSRPVGADAVPAVAPVEPPRLSVGHNDDWIDDRHFWLLHPLCFGSARYWTALCIDANGAHARDGRSAAPRAAGSGWGCSRLQDFPVEGRLTPPSRRAARGAPSNDL